MWVVVEFIEESLVEAIPNIWVIEHNLVSWPGSVKPEQLKKNDNEMCVARRFLRKMSCQNIKQRKNLW